MLDLQVFPERSLGSQQWEFTLGMPLLQAVHILEKQCRIIDEVEVIYDERNPFDTDVVLNLVSDGIRLLFDPTSQLLKVIEVYDMSKTKLKYCDAYFNSPNVQPNYSQIQKLFGAAHSPDFDEKHSKFAFRFRGITFLFPADQPYETKGTLTIKPSAVVSKMSIYNGTSLNSTSAPEMPPCCYHGNVYSALTDVVMNNGHCEALQLKLSGEGNECDGKIQTLIRRVQFGDTVQDVLSNIGSPCETFYKLEDKMRIHSSGPHKFLPLSHSDYFYNYFTLGIDILFDGHSHKVKKFILHTNHPGHYNFNIYYRSEFKIDLQGEKGAFTIAPTTRWNKVKELLGGSEVVGDPVVLTRASSTNNTNPFGSTHCYGFQNMIFEVMPNNYIASVTLYEPNDDDN